eukprot:CAMPEP_0178752100 /NCGR_PEP_ID=MMETSP0744-20121128/10878_1 /TAXON_ID=913974 /ORGANISM="Nitzschia punctata, Strain CCMP561" /LENGTH=358 /DNA_ID=CAMNT_0020405787 /DNA_START=122 /DNA_END=1195 /DNA_ORIENTATION=+
MIAFSPYRAKGKMAKYDPTGRKRRLLNSYTLAATIASLYQVGFGRVTVVGINDEDPVHFEGACQLLASIYPPPGLTANGTAFLENNNSITTATITKTRTITIGVTNMEIGYVRVTNRDWITTNFAKYNVPRAALVGMQYALNGAMDINRTERAFWLGTQHNDPNYWEYVYLTEPDTILNTKPELLTLFKEALDSGLSLFPHRLHILPHEADLPPVVNNFRTRDEEYVLNAGEFLPNEGHFANISVIIPNDTNSSHTYDTDTPIYSSCCDDGREWPGKEGWERFCRPWWTCGFRNIQYKEGEAYNATALVENHPRLLLYPMMRLETGVGAVFAASNHGRRCLPSKTGCDSREAVSYFIS